MKSSGKSARGMGARNVDLETATARPGGGSPPFDPLRRRAIVIGINRYDDPNIGNLASCLADVDSMFQVMTDPAVGMFSKDHVTVLRSDSPDPEFLPTRENILRAIEQIGEEAQNVDEVWFYFAGHGYAVPDDKTGDGYLVPMNGTFDTRHDRPHRESLISTQDMHSHWFRNSLPTQTIVMFMDCCCAGSMGWSGKRIRNGDGADKLHRQAFEASRCQPDDEERDPEYFCFQAAARNQPAHDGNYTRHLVRALKGEPPCDGRDRSSRNDGTVTVATVSAFLGDVIVGQDPHNMVDGSANHVLSYDPVRRRAYEERKTENDTVRQWINRLETSHDFDEQADFDRWRQALGKDGLPADVLHFFGMVPDGEPRLWPANADTIAVRILSALLPVKVATKADPEPETRPFPAQAPAPPPSARPLSAEERQRLRAVAAGILKNEKWGCRDYDSRWKALSAAETEEAALAAIRAVKSLLLDEFTAKNPMSPQVLNPPLARLAPLLPSGLRLTFSAPLSSVDSALQNLLSLARTLCRHR